MAGFQHDHLAMEIDDEVKARTEWEIALGYFQRALKAHNALTKEEAAQPGATRTPELIPKCIERCEEAIRQLGEIIRLKPPK